MHILGVNFLFTQYDLTAKTQEVGPKKQTAEIKLFFSFLVLLLKKRRRPVQYHHIRMFSSKMCR